MLRLPLVPFVPLVETSVQTDVGVVDERKAQRSVPNTNTARSEAEDLLYHKVAKKLTRSLPTVGWANEECRGQPRDTSTTSSGSSTNGSHLNEKVNVEDKPSWPQRCMHSSPDLSVTSIVRGYWF